VHLLDNKPDKVGAASSSHAPELADS